MRRHSRATATGSGKMMIDLRHEHEIDTAGTWWSAMGQNRRCRQRLSTAGLPSTAEEMLPCQAIPKWQSPRTGNWRLRIGAEQRPHPKPLYAMDVAWKYRNGGGT